MECFVFSLCCIKNKCLIVFYDSLHSFSEFFEIIFTKFYSFRKEHIVVKPIFYSRSCTKCDMWIYCLLYSLCEYMS